MMAVVWTDELKAKAAATRAETKRKKEEREAKRAAKAGVEAGGYNGGGDQESIAASHHSSANANGFDWTHAPIEEAMARLSAMKKEYDRVAQIVMQRQTQSRPKWICWTQLHKDVVAKNVQALCRKSGEDGRWASRDDGVFKMVDGIRVPDPVFCCNASCHETYLRSKTVMGLARH